MKSHLKHFPNEKKIDKPKYTVFTEDIFNVIHENG